MLTKSNVYFKNSLRAYSVKYYLLLIVLLSQLWKTFEVSQQFHNGLAIILALDTAL